MVMRLPRYPFWLMISFAISFLFIGNEPNVLTRVQNNWVGSLIVLVVSFFWGGRVGLTETTRFTRFSISNKMRITLRVSGVVIFILGILIEIFLYWLPEFVLDSLIIICVIVAPNILYVSYAFNKK